MLSLDFDNGTGTVAYDRSTYGTDGTLVGATWSADAQTGTYAVEFDGTGQHVEMSLPTQLQFTGNDSFTLEFWAKPNLVSNAILCEIYNGASGSFIFIGMNDVGVNNCEPFAVMADESAETIAIFPSVPFPQDVYYHFALVYDGVTHTGTFYVNSAPIGSSTNLSFTDDIYNSTSKLNLGYSTGLSQPYGGLIDGFRASNKARTTDEFPNSLMALLPSFADISCMEEYYSDDSDLNVNDMREDFREIWKQNIQQVELIRERNPQAGDYFHDDEDNIELRTRIWMNIQGISSDAYTRMDAGIITPNATLKAYVEWNTDIENLDVIKVGEYTYRISDYNKSQHNGQFVFKEFNLKRIGKESTSVGGTC
jgi:hypothetical protein